MIGFSISAMVAVITLVAMVIFGLCGNDVAFGLCVALCVIANIALWWLALFGFRGC
jgi:hypothetical protein